MQENTKPLDLIWGVKSISTLIGRTERQTFHLLASGNLPAKQVGNRWVANRDALTRFFEETAA